MSEIQRQKDLLKQIVSQLSGDIDEEIELVPAYGICGESGGYMFCFQPSSKSFVKIYKNQKVYIIAEYEKGKRFLIYTTCGKLVEIDSEKVYPTDFD